MKYLVFFVVFLSSFAVAQNPEYEALSENLKRLDNVSADFVQHTFDGKGALLQTQKGRLSLKQPNKFRWESLEPYAQLLVSNGEMLWQYDADLEQVTEQVLNKKLSATPALLLSGDTDQISSEYDIYSEVLQGEEHFVLIPKQVDVLFDRLRLEFAADKNIERMVIQDEVGQKTIIRFQNIVTSKTLKSSDFEFTPPKGVDVIRSE
ncbi:MAG: outer membrane lipoprotein carrier protein LolA [Bermanella sp.]|nr:outer membrane lipoprotein carrier protein LolA [Bermanella sp.]